MDDQQVGIAVRSIRVRKRWRQKDQSAMASVSRSMIVGIERGRLETGPGHLSLDRVLAAIRPR
jgi:transcriptional regulator with XRE-family HTH domain